jgi:hypothetical protein
MDVSLDDDPAMADTRNLSEAPLPHDSMVTVRLSGPPSLTLITQSLAADGLQDPMSALETPMDISESKLEDSLDDELPSPSRHSIPSMAEEERSNILTEVVDEQLPQNNERRGSQSTESSGDGEVNWAELEKTEEQEPRDQDSEDVSNAHIVLINSSNFVVYCFTACEA